MNQDPASKPLRLATACMKAKTPLFPIASLLALLAILPGLLDTQAANARKEQLPRFDRVLQIEDSSETSANVEFGDINRDGHPDLILAKGRHWPLVNRVVLGDGKGGILKSYDLGSESNRTYSGRLVDLDNDGDLDVVVSNDNPDRNLIHLNDGNGHFRTDSTFGDPDWSTRYVCVTDLNNDGLPDIVVANRNSRRKTDSYICLNIGNGRFSDQSIPFSSGSSTTISAADFNDDGLMDLAVPYRDGGQSYVYFQTKTNGLEFDRVPFGPADASIRTSQAGDFDGDGKMDLVTIDTKRGASLYFQKADNAFATGKPIGKRSSRPYALAVSDLNRDGAIDVIVGHVKAPSVIHFNKGSGQSFTALKFGDNRGVVYGFATGDFDMDGQLDIAAARSDAPNSLYFGSLPTKTNP
mgnify:CR=1 FL=1